MPLSVTHAHTQPDVWAVCIYTDRLFVLAFKNGLLVGLGVLLFFFPELR